MARAQATTDHQVIRHWIEAHNGHPSVVRATQSRRKGSAGLLRVDFDEAEESLEEVSWDDFFDTFDQNNLVFLFQDEKDSRFHKFVKRDSVDESDLEGESEEDSSTRSSPKSASATSRGNSGGKTRQASPAEEEEIEEINEEELEEEEEEDEDFDAGDEDEDLDEDEEPSRGKKR